MTRQGTKSKKHRFFFSKNFPWALDICRYYSFTMIFPERQWRALKFLKLWRTSIEGCIRTRAEDEDEKKENTPFHLKFVLASTRTTRIKSFKEAAFPFMVDRNTTNLYQIPFNMKWCTKTVSSTLQHMSQPIRGLLWLNTIMFND